MIANYVLLIIHWSWNSCWVVNL